MSYEDRIKDKLYETYMKETKEKLYEAYMIGCNELEEHPSVDRCEAIVLENENIVVNIVIERVEQ